MNLKSIYGKIKRAPKTLRNLCAPYYAQWHRFIIRCRCRRTQQINVLFLVELETSCKWESVYLQMVSDAHFSPLIVVCPKADCEYEEMLNRLQKCYKHFADKHYNVIMAYDANTKKYMDIRSLHPDCIFYTNPYPWIADNRYYIDTLNDIYSCYISYTYNAMRLPEFYNLSFHKKLWRYYLENESIKNEFEAILNHKEEAYRVTGYPSLDMYKHYNESRVHKSKKVFIWAPHHSVYLIFDHLNRNSFLLYYDFMLEMAQKFKDVAEFVFRPHPLLKERLYTLETWGKGKTDAYFRLWEEYDNCRYSENEDYMQEFANSDAMIHDCVSFTIEYLYALKPVLFTGKLSEKENQTNNQTLKAAYDCYEFANSQQEIEDFIVRVINGEVDLLKEKKEQFNNAYLRSLEGNTAAENIINDLKEALL